MSGVFGVADAHVQGGMVGDLSFMRPEFIQVNTFFSKTDHELQYVHGNFVSKVYFFKQNTPQMH